MKMKSGTPVVLVGVATFLIGGVLGHIFTRRYFILGDQEELMYRHSVIEREALINVWWLEELESTDGQAREGHRRAALDSLHRYLEDVESMRLGADWRFVDRVKAYLDQQSAPKPEGDSPTTSPD